MNLVVFIRFANFMMGVLLRATNYGKAKAGATRSAMHDVGNAASLCRAEFVQNSLVTCLIIIRGSNTKEGSNG